MTDLPNAWLRGYTASGRLVSLTVTGNDIDELCQKIIEADAKMTACGIAVREPGLDDGEIKDVYHYVSRRAKVGDDGVETPLIDLYPENFDYAALKVYLNTDADVAAFESASGLRVRDIPLNPNHKNAAARNDAQDARYIRSFPTPLVGIKKKNPAYNPEETDLKKKKPQYLFVRWQNAKSGDLSAANAQAATTQAGNGNGANSGLPRSENWQATSWVNTDDWRKFEVAVFDHYGFVPSDNEWMNAESAAAAYNAIRGAAEKEQWDMIATSAKYTKMANGAGTIEFNTDLPAKMFEGRTQLAKWLHLDENFFKNWQDGETYELPFPVVVSWQREGNTRGNAGYRKVYAVNPLPTPAPASEDVPF